MRQCWILTTLVPSCTKCTCPDFLEGTKEWIWWEADAVMDELYQQSRKQRPHLALTAAQKHHSPLQGGVSLAPSLSIPHRMGVMSPGDRAQLFCGPCVLKDPVAALCYRTTVSAKPASGTCTVSSFTHFMASVSAHLSPESRNWRTNTLQGLAPYVTFQWAE